MAAISVEEDDSGPALRISRGKAFCYGLGIDPDVDYVLTVQFRCRNAKVRIEASFPLPRSVEEAQPQPGSEWQTLVVRMPADARPGGTREIWIALGVEPIQPHGAVWYREVKLQRAGELANIVPNSDFRGHALDVEVPHGWVLDQGGANTLVDTGAPRSGNQSLRITGVDRPVRLTQTLAIAKMGEQRPRRVRVSGWGRCEGLGSDRIRLEVYGAGAEPPPILSLSGDMEWTKGEVVVDVTRQTGREPAIWIHAPNAFSGRAWFDDIQIAPVPDEETVNLLWNASFQPSDACPDLPDYWGLYGDALLGVEPWSFDFFGLSDEPGPVAGARTLRISHPAENAFVPMAGANRLNMFVLSGTPLELPAGEYTFSIYAKAKRAGTAVLVRHPASGETLATADVGPDWQRIIATSSNVKLLPAVHIPDPGSCVWLAAPQLEPGSSASQYRHPPGTNAPVKKYERTGGKQSEKTSASRFDFMDENPTGFRSYAEFDRITDDPALHARVEWAGATPATVHWRVIDAASGQPLIANDGPILLQAAGQRTIEIPTAGLPDGAIGIQAVVDVNGHREARAVDVFLKQSLSAERIRINRFSRSVTVDAVPFFPVFLPLEPWKLRDWHFKRLVWAGFNCLVGPPGKLSLKEVSKSGLSDKGIATIRRELDRLDSHGLKLLWPLAWSFNDWADAKELYGGDVSGLATTFQRVVAEFRDHPAIIGWYVFDEPSPRNWEKELGFTEPGLQELWAAVKKADPTRPAYINWNHAWSTAPYGGFGATDIVGHDNYIISGESFDYGELVRTVRMVNAGRPVPKPAFAWISGSYNEVAMRPPPEAVRVHAWLHLVYGTRGLGYWSGPPMDPRVWTEMRRINRDAVVLHRHVLGDAAARVVACGQVQGDIHYSISVVEDFAYLWAVNTAAYPSVLDLDLRTVIGRDLVAARRLFDDRSFEVIAGTMKDDFPPFSRQVYRFSLRDAVP